MCFFVPYVVEKGRGLSVLSALVVKRCYLSLLMSLGLIMFSKE
ncbi:MAG: hypothetical protein JWP12_2056 [Bacteroidetes bacterium]|nr:hypothetical protein [Bacteroidota bacterium]